MKLIAVFLLWSGFCVGQPELLKIEFRIKGNKQVVDACKFYVSDIQITYSDPDAEDRFTNHQLVDFEEKESLTLEFTPLRGKAIEQIAFSIGTDSIVNVSGAFDGDLDPIHGMYWTWNSGYINIKLEGKIQNQAFEYHIGGYQGENKTLRRKEFKIKNPAQRQFIVEIDMDQFFESVERGDEMRVMLPGKDAAILATEFSDCLYIVE